MAIYGYRGAVMIFNHVVCNDWYGQTSAVSEKQAKSNLAYQYKQENQLMPTVKVSLPGKVYII